MLKLRLIFIICSVNLFTEFLFSQNFTNPSFSSGGTGWGGSTEVHAENVYGGSSASNNVAEIDYLVKLSQTVTGFVVGNSYSLGFYASRRTKSGAASPNPSSINISISSSTSTILSATLTKTNTSFNLVYVSYDFVANATSLTFSFTPGSDIGTSTKGVIVDNFSITQYVPLSVEFVDFKLLKEYKGIEVNWQTETETNCDYFIVERSENGYEWVELNKQFGAGNSSKKLKYSFFDLHPINGLSYYRIRQFDFDGKDFVTDVKSINFDYSDLISIFPNPIQLNKLLFINSEIDLITKRVLIVDCLGNIVLDEVISTNGVYIENINKGAYIVYINDGSQNICIRNIVVI